MKNKDNTYENISKLYRHLLSKGFEYDKVSSVITQFKE